MLLWNLAERHEEIILRYRGVRRRIGVDGLAVSFIEGIGT